MQKKKVLFNREIYFESIPLSAKIYVIMCLTFSKSFILEVNKKRDMYPKEHYNPKLYIYYLLLKITY